MCGVKQKYNPATAMMTINARMILNNLLLSIKSPKIKISYNITENGYEIT